MKNSGPGSVKIIAIQIKMPDGTVVKLTIEEARELHTQLDDVFKGLDPVYIPALYAPPLPDRDYWPKPLPEKPYHWDNPITTGTPIPRWPTILCITNNE